MEPPNAGSSSQKRNYPLIVQALSTVPLIAAVIKRVTIVKENITPQFVKKRSNILLTTNDNHVTYPLFIIDIEGIKCRALIDTGVGTSYASFIDQINKKPIRKQYKRIN